MSEQPTIPGVRKGVTTKTSRSAIIATLSELIRRTALGDVKPGPLAAELRALATLIEGKAVDEDGTSSPANQEMLELAKRLFAYWRKASGKSRATLTQGRKRKIYARIRGGYNELQLRAAIDGCCSDEWHAEKGKTELEYIFRSDTQVEEFIERSGGVEGRELDPALDDDVAAEVAKLEARAMEALDRGDHEKYEELQQQIERIRRG